MGVLLALSSEIFRRALSKQQGYNGCYELFRDVRCAAVAHRPWYSLDEIGPVAAMTAVLVSSMEWLSNSIAQFSNW